MVVLAVSQSARPLLAHFLKAADGAAYTDKNHWNSLREPVQAACSYASGGQVAHIIARDMRDHRK
jgi:hypothetical protein